MSPATQAPLTVYGSSISYFTGKLENYLRLRGIPYRLQAMTPRFARLMQEQTGSTQMPAVQLSDDRWLSDTTPMIQWFEEQCDGPPIIPADPLQRFFSLLLEDYADEWLWRPAMHFRWFYNRGARFASTHLAEEVAAGTPLPAFAKRLLITQRQRRGYTSGDGIARDQVQGVEAIYLRTLVHLSTIFSNRPFLLGSRPSLADIGFSGPIFRHFGLDPVPAEIMRRQAPAVWEWSGRLWNSDLEAADPAPGIPDDWGPLLEDIGDHYLPYLNANVAAVAAGRKRFDIAIGGVEYRGARSSRYRVWCLSELRRHFNALTAQTQIEARSLLEKHRCWTPLWRESVLPMATGFCERLPFHVDAKAIDVYD